MAGITDQWFEKKPAATGDPKRAMTRLQETFRSRDYLTATTKMRSRIAGAPAPSLTDGEKKALERAEHDYEVAKVGEPARQDVGYDGRSITPTPPAPKPFAYDFLIRIAQERDPFIRSSNARQARLEIQRGDNVMLSGAYYDESDPAHKTVVEQVQELYKIENE